MSRIVQFAARRATPLFIAAALIVGFWRLNLNGLGNTYYAAADLTGAHDLRALFFAAFDRNGVMSVDKPPLGLVGPALAIRLFGLSSWTVLGPQVVFFAATVRLLHNAARRWFGPRAAALAAASFALTPINVAIARSNNPDALLVLLTLVGLVLAVESVRDQRVRTVAGAGFVVGLAFTTKQMRAIVAVRAPRIASCGSGLMCAVWSRTSFSTSVRHGSRTRTWTGSDSA